MRFLLSIITLALASLCTAQDKVEYCRYAFDEGTMPEGFQQWDVDGRTPHFTAVQSGLDEGIAWAVLREANVYPYNYYVASHSRHKKISGEDLVEANDWLVLPSVMVRADDAVLTWRSNSVSENLEQTSTYHIRVSTQGNRPEDFTEAALFTVDADPLNTWVEHEVSLGKYVGKQVWIALQNTTLNGELLAVDDIALTGGEGTYTFTTNLDPYVLGENSFQPQLTLTNLSDQPIPNFTVRSTSENGSVYSNQILSPTQPGESATVDCWSKILAYYGDTLRLNISVEVDGVSSDVLKTQTVFLSFKPEQHIVIEEGTGDWCGYCPQGVVALREVEERWGDLVLPICVHSDDQMEVPGYIGDQGLYFPEGFPSGHINRRYSSTPMKEVHEGRKSVWTIMEGGFGTWVEAEAACVPMAELSFRDTGIDNKGEIAVHGKVRFCITQVDMNLRLAAILTERSWKDASNKQKNYYAGGSTEMGGFENEASTITGFEFEHIARAAAQQAFRGVSGLLPTDVRADQEYEYDLTIQVPNVGHEVGEWNVTVMLIDGDTGCILNACRNAVSNAIGIDNIENQNQPDVAYDLQGRRVLQMNRGIYVINGKKVMR